MTSKTVERACDKLHEARQVLERFGFGDAATIPHALVVEAIELLEAHVPEPQGSAARGAGEPAQAGGGSAPFKGPAEMLEAVLGPLDRTGIYLPLAGRIVRATEVLRAIRAQNARAVADLPQREKGLAVLRVWLVQEWLDALLAILEDGEEPAAVAAVPTSTKPEGQRGEI